MWTLWLASEGSVVILMGRGLTGATTWQPRISQSAVSGSPTSLAPMSSRNCLAWATHSNPTGVLWSIITYAGMSVDHSGPEMLLELRTMVWAPLSHISLTRALRDEGVGIDESENAESARTSCACERGIRSPSWNDLCQETIISLRLTSAHLMIK